MARIKHILQHDKSDCGAACLCMVLQYYGKTVPIRKIRVVAGTDCEGTSGYGIVKAAQKFGLSCKGFMSPERNRLETIPLPAIFHVKETADHYVVVHKIKDGKIYISDPAIGPRKEKISDFTKWWSGVFFLLYPDMSFEKGNDSDGLLLRFLSLLRPHRQLVARVVVASLLLSLFGIFISFYFRFLIDEVLYSQIQSTLNLCSICYLLIIAFQAALSFCRSQIILFLGEKIDVSLSSDFFLHLLRLPMSFFSTRKTGEILSRIGDAKTIRNAISSTTLSILIDSFMFVVGGFFLFKMGSNLLPVAIIPVLVSSVLVRLFARPFKHIIKKRAVVEADKNATMYESINGIATIKSLATESMAFLRVEEKIVDSAEKSLELGQLGNIQKALQDFVSGCGTLTLYWVGSYLIFDGVMTLGQLISFVTLSGFFLGPLKRLLTMQLHLQEIMISAERLSDIIDMEEEFCDEECKLEPENLAGCIEFRDVSFSYGTRGRAVEKVSLSIEAGQKVAFVGMSGSGKTTLLKLLMKFYDCEEGKIFVNGTDIAEYKTNSYRSKIGYVPQESLLFSGTIEDNICWGEFNTDRRRIVASAVAAQAMDFIDRLPDKFNTVVGEHGSTLSGGERQRIALARVLMRSPHFLVLDEATASLDSISEQAIMNTVFNRIHDRIVIMVAHRLSTIRNCDKIFVFNSGKIVEQGTHRALLKKKGHYYNLWSAQNEKTFGITASE